MQRNLPLIRQVDFAVNYEKKGEQAVSLLENLLDKGKIVAVDTLLQQAKFSQKYTPDFLYTSQSSGHIFTAVAHDDSI